MQPTTLYHTDDHAAKTRHWTTADLNWTESSILMNASAAGNGDGQDE